MICASDSVGHAREPAARPRRPVRDRPCRRNGAGARRLTSRARNEISARQPSSREEAIGVDDPEHLAHGVGGEQRSPVPVGARPVQVTEPEAQGAAERFNRAVILAQPGVTAGDAVGDFAGEQEAGDPPAPDAQLGGPLIGGQRAAEVVPLEAGLAQAGPVAALDRVALHHLLPQRRGRGPPGRAAARLRLRHGPQVARPRPSRRCPSRPRPSAPVHVTPMYVPPMPVISAT